MAKTILAIAHTPRTLLQIQEILQAQARVWAYGSLAAAQRAVAEGVKPQLLIAPLVLVPESDTPYSAELVGSRLRHVPTILFATPAAQQRHAAALHGAAAVLDEPLEPLALLRAVAQLSRR